MEKRDDKSKSNQSGNKAKNRTATRPNMMPSLTEYSSSTDSNSPELENKKSREKKASADSYFMNYDERENGEEEEEEDEEDEENSEEIDDENNEIDEDQYVKYDPEEDEKDEQFEEDDEDEEYAVTRPLKQDSGDSSGIASNSNSDQTIMPSPVILKNKHKNRNKNITFIARDISLVS